MKLWDLIKNNQQKLVLAAGFILVALIAFLLGRLTAFQAAAPDISVQEVFASPSNYTPAVAGVQSQSDKSPDNTSTAPDCAGKIKGSSSRIYHLPGDAFYDRTTKPIQCFDTEAQAQSAGFRKSSQ